MAASQRAPEPAIASVAPAGPLADLVPGLLDCVHCGLCAERCPTAAWDMQKFTLLHPKASDEADRPAPDKRQYGT